MLLLVLVFGLTAMNVHRFYVAIYQINFVPEKTRMEITTRIFVDDLNQAIQKDFHQTTFLGSEKETPEAISLMKKYLAEKFKVSIDGKYRAMNYISSEMENNVIICYFSIKNISKVSSLEVENTILTELFSEQQNIVQYTNNKNKKNLLLTKETTKGMLK